MNIHLPLYLKITIQTRARVFFIRTFDWNLFSLCCEWLLQANPIRTIIHRFYFNGFSICPSISTFTMTLSMLVYCHNTKSHQHQIFHRPFFLYHVFSSAISCPWTRKFVLDSIWNKLIRSQSLSVYFHLSDLTRINWNNSWSWKVVQLSLHKMSLTKKVAAITKVNTCKSTFVNMYHYWHSQLEMKHRH